jgi:hypothetical protein
MAEFLNAYLDETNARMYSGIMLKSNDTLLE